MALIKELSLRSFRSFPERKFVFDASDVVFTGENGTGKSNVLEALGYLSTLRSFRRSGVRDMINIGSDFFELGAVVAGGRSVSNLTVREQLGGARQLLVNNAPVKLGDFLFATVNAARLYGLNPDTALERTCAKFRRRFTYLEEHTIRQGRNLTDMTLAEMDAIWDEGKAKGL